MTKNTILIFNPAIVRKLLKIGYRIVDVKAHRDNPDKTVFIFANEPGLEMELAKHSRA